MRPRQQNPRRITPCIAGGGTVEIDIVPRVVSPHRDSTMPVHVGGAGGVPQRESLRGRGFKPIACRTPPPPSLTTAYAIESPHGTPRVARLCRRGGGSPCRCRAGPRRTPPDPAGARPPARPLRGHCRGAPDADVAVAVARRAVVVLKSNPVELPLAAVADSSDSCWASSPLPPSLPPARFLLLPPSPFPCSSFPSHVSAAPALSWPRWRGGPFPSPPPA